METIEVVIRIPKDLYEGIECRNGELETEYVCDELMKAVDNGTVLPKGHGRLIDADSMKRIDAIQRGDFNNIESIRAWIDIMPTVIEADKEAEDESD